jgi:hypothetical protein
MGGDPPLTALVLHGVLSRLGVRAGEPIEVQLPADAVKTFADV